MLKGTITTVVELEKMDSLESLAGQRFLVVSLGLYNIGVEIEIGDIVVVGSHCTKFLVFKLENERSTIRFYLSNSCKLQYLPMNNPLDIELVYKGDY